MDRAPALPVRPPRFAPSCEAAPSLSFTESSRPRFPDARGLPSSEPSGDTKAQAAPFDGPGASVRAMGLAPARPLRFAPASEAALPRAPPESSRSAPPDSRRATSAFVDESNPLVPAVSLELGLALGRLFLSMRARCARDSRLFRCLPHGPLGAGGTTAASAAVAWSYLPHLR